jgi:hypothetical protein
VTSQELHVIRGGRHVLVVRAYPGLQDQPAARFVELTDTAKAAGGVFLERLDEALVVVVDVLNRFHQTFRSFVERPRGKFIGEHHVQQAVPQETNLLLRKTTRAKGTEKIDVFVELSFRVAVQTVVQTIKLWKARHIVAVRVGLFATSFSRFGYRTAHGHESASRLEVRARTLERRVKRPVVSPKAPAEQSHALVHNAPQGGAPPTPPPPGLDVGVFYHAAVTAAPVAAAGAEREHRATVESAVSARA